MTETTLAPLFVLRSRRAQDASRIDLAKQAATSRPERMPVGIVFFSAEKCQVVRAIAEYAATHSLANRGAVVRGALAHLLGIEVAVR